MQFHLNWLNRYLIILLAMIETAHRFFSLLVLNLVCTQKVLKLKALNLFKCINYLLGIIWCFNKGCLCYQMNHQHTKYTFNALHKCSLLALKGTDKSSEETLPYWWYWYPLYEYILMLKRWKEGATLIYELNYLSLNHYYNKEKYRLFWMNLLVDYHIWHLCFKVYDIVFLNDNSYFGIL